MDNHLRQSCELFLAVVFLFQDREHHLQKIRQYRQAVKPYSYTKLSFRWSKAREEKEEEE